MQIAPIAALGMAASFVAVVTALAMFVLVVWQAAGARDNQLLSLFLAAIVAWGAFAFAARIATTLGGTSTTVFLRAAIAAILLAALFLHALVLRCAGMGGHWWSRISVGAGVLCAVFASAALQTGLLIRDHVMLADGTIRFRLMPLGYVCFAVTLTQCFSALAITRLERSRALGWLMPGVALFTVAVAVLPTALGRVSVPILIASIASLVLARAILKEKLFSPLHAANCELEESRARLSALVDNTDDGIWSVDAALRLTACNSGYRRSYTEKGVQIGESAIAGFEPALRERWRGMYDRALAGERFAVEQLANGPDGVRVYEVAFNPIRDPRGLPCGVAVLARDVTERKREAALKDEFVAVVSHELRTPLTAIIGSLGLLRTGAVGEVSPQVEEFLSIMDQGAKRLLALVNDLLDIQKLESGAIFFENRPVPIAALLGEAVDAHRGYAALLGVRLRLDAVAQVVVEADPDRLMQVLANLISNAAKFSPRGAEVTLAATQVADSVCISVRDRGPGIPAAFRSRVFEKFAQAEGASARTHAGTGLGLAISQTIVERLGGRLRFETEEGNGTIFFLELPLTQRSAPRPDPVSRTAAVSRGSLADRLLGNTHQSPQRADED